MMVACTTVVGMDMRRCIQIFGVFGVRANMAWGWEVKVREKSKMIPRFCVLRLELLNWED